MGVGSEGRFEAIGVDLETSRDWRLILGLIGVFQVFAVLGLADLRLISQNPTYAQVSLLLLLPSFALLGLLRRNTKMGKVRVRWVDNRDKNGELELSYVNARGKKRSGLIVSKVTERPNEPLWVAGISKYNPAVPVTDMDSSLIIDFKNRRGLSLGLGFDNSREMGKVYDQLK